MPEDPRRARAGRPLSIAGLLQHAAWGLEAIGLALVWGVLRLLGPERAGAVGRALLRRVGPLARKHQHVRRNLSFVLADRPELDREAVAREVWGHFGEVLGELAHLDRFVREAERRIEVRVEGDPAIFSPGAKPVVFVTAHVGNWELTPLGAARLGLSLSGIYSPPANPWAERFGVWLRRSLPFELVSKRSGLRALVRALDAGRSIGIVMDVRLDEGELVPFFGVPAPTSTVAARLALQRGCALVPMRAQRIGAARYRMVFEAPILPDPTITDRGEQARHMTRGLNARFESWIRSRPEDWWCIRRRWPRDASPALHAGDGATKLSA